MKPTQRFIAGANCPKCKETDALLIDARDQSIECVECGFQQTAEERDQQAADGAAINKQAPEKVAVSDIIRVKQVK